MSTREVPHEARDFSDPKRQQAIAAMQEMRVFHTLAVIAAQFSETRKMPPQHTTHMMAAPMAPSSAKSVAQDH